MIDSKVSIITPVYNSAKYMKKCIDSVLNQTYSNFEHILVDDCSTDNSVAIIEEYFSMDRRIKLIKLSENEGAGIARNTAIEMAKGRFIAFLDSDDVWDSEKLEKQITFMIKNNCPFTFTSYGLINENGKPLKKTVKAKSFVSYKLALYSNPIGCLTAIYDTAFYGKRYMPDIRKRQDYALWLSLLKESNGIGLQESLAFYRVRLNSISSNKLNLIKYQWDLYRNIEKLSAVKSVFYLTTSFLAKIRTAL
ncbi:glycosyltransferase family 2 protein [Sinomicrobium sp. M5D2P17]